MSFNLIPELPQTHYHVVYVTSSTEYSTYVLILPHFSGFSGHCNEWNDVQSVIIAK